MSASNMLKDANVAGLQALTLWPTPDGRWQANARVGSGGWLVAIDSDPDEAVARVIAQLKPAGADALGFLD